jgi:integrase
MSIFKRKGSRNWQCEWSIGGKTIKESSGTADRKAAQEFHDRRSAELWRLQKFGEHSTTFEQAALAWWNEHASTKRSAETDRIRLRRVAHEFAGMQIATITTPALDRFAVTLRREGSAPSTINKSLSIASGILRHSARKGWIQAMPVIPWVKVQSQDYQWLTKTEATALLALLPDHLRQLARFSLMTGVRRDNATHLEWSRVDLDRRVCWVEGEDSKNGKPLSIPLNDDAIAVLHEQQGQHIRWCFTYRNKVVTETTTKAWKAAVAAIGRPSVTWHDLRHTWASWHAQAGTDLRLLMQLGGWSDIKMVLRYAHLAPGFAAPYASNVSLSPAVSPTVGEIYDGESTQLIDSMGWLMGLEPTTTGITRHPKLKKVA